MKTTRTFLKTLFILASCLLLLFVLVSCGQGEKGETGEKGEQGEKGETGVGITKVEFNDSGELVISFSDGTSMNAGKITSPDDNPCGFDFIPLPDGTYGVQFGNSYALEEITFPSTYKGKPISAIMSPQKFNVSSSAWAVKKITIPKSVKTIHASAFEYISSLETVIFEEGSMLEKIENGAFKGCTNLKSITIPNGVTSIGQDAFLDCKSLECSEYDNAYYLVSENNKYLALVKAKNAQIEACEIHSDTKFIFSSAFSDCSSLTSITIPEGVTSIGYDAFNGCTSLTSITIPNSVTSIGYNAFNGCTSLTSITIPNSVTSIGSYAFNGCTSLTSITIPEGVTSIGSSAFYCCTSLTSITIPNSVTSIGYNAFNGCTSLTSITIPNSVTSIGYDAFDGCDSLIIYAEASAKPSGWSYYLNEYKSVIWNFKELYTDEQGVIYALRNDNTASVTDFNSTATEIAIPEAVNGYLVTDIFAKAFYDCNSLTSITIPESVTSIGNYAFYGCYSLTSITIPNSVTSIGSSAFSHCISLTSITIPESVTSIGSNAFKKCRSLKSITIPASVTSIGSSAFSYCTSLDSIRIPESVTSIGSYAFSDCTSLTSITFADTSTWYRTTNYTDWEIKKNGTEIDLTDAATNAVYFKRTYLGNYWYKE